MIHKLGRYSLPSSSNSAFTREFIKAYIAGLKILANPSSPHVDSAPHVVLAAAKLNYYGLAIPAELFKQAEPGHFQGMFDLCQRDIRAGISHLPSPVYQPIGSFEGFFDPLRAQRRPGLAKKIDLAIDAPFRPGENRFEPKIREETFWTPLQNGRPMPLIYNILPFAPFCSLIIPDKATGGLNQYLGNSERLKVAWDFMQRANDPNLRLAFSSLGSHATKNQLHFHLFYVTNEWQPSIERVVDFSTFADGRQPIEDWPLSFTTFFKGQSEQTLQEAYDCISQLHAKAKASPNTIAFCLYLRPDGIVLFPRKHQATYVDYMNTEGQFNTGPAWLELIGTFIMSGQQYLKSTTEQDIRGLYREISLSDRPFN